MQFITIGKRTINIERVTEISDFLGQQYGSENKIRVYFGAEVATLADADADLFREWLPRQSQDIAADNDTHAAALGLAREVCDWMGGTEIADKEHAYELLTKFIDVYWAPLNQVLKDAGA